LHFFGKQWCRPSLAECTAVGTMVALIGFAGCSKAARPSEPDPSHGALLGTWTGNISGEAIGTGSAAIVLAVQIESPSATLVSGTWSFVFPNPMFSGTGTVSGELSAGTLGLLFSRPVAPCPGEPGDVAQRTAVASLKVSGNRMQGYFGVVGCPGGTLDLVRK
jgi:hypothetical protein